MKLPFCLLSQGKMFMSGAQNHSSFFFFLIALCLLFSQKLTLHIKAVQSSSTTSFKIIVETLLHFFLFLAYFLEILNKQYI